jgi:hypothetical protein
MSILLRSHSHFRCGKINQTASVSDTIIPTLGENITVRAADAGDEAAWDGFLAAHSALPPFADFAWGQVLQDVFKVEPIRIIAEGEDYRIRGLLAAYAAKGSGAEPVIYSLDRGFVAETVAAENNLLAALNRILHDLGAAKAFVSTAQRPCTALAEDANRQAVVLPLSTNEEENWRALRAKTRNMVRKSQKLGVMVEADLGGLEAFYEIYADRMLGLGVPIYGLSLLRSIIEGFPGKVDLLVARLDGEIIGGLFLIYGRETGAYPFQATKTRQLDTAATQFLIWEAARRCAQRGLSRLDMGKSSPGSSVHKSKVNFGGVAEDVFHYTIAPTALSDCKALSISGKAPLLRRVSTRLANEAMQRGPAMIKRPVGLWLKRQGRLLF